MIKLLLNIIIYMCIAVECVLAAVYIIIDIFAGFIEYIKMMCIVWRDTLYKDLF